MTPIADAQGNPLDTLDFTPFGQRRSPSQPDTSTDTAPALTPRGFTGHEHLDGTGLIHMNGRVYDPELGRFLQADPLIQAPDNAQSWNAYTYAFNNPLVYTDPTGLFSLRQVLGLAIAVIGSIVAPQFSNVWAKIGYAMAIGFASGYVSTGTFRGGVIGAFAAGMTAGIAQLSYANNLSNWQQVGLQATSGGITESLSGGKFGNGFVSAGLTATFMPQVGTIQNDIGRATTGALVGGTISAATGGKFANGAVSGAVQAAMSRQSVANDEITPGYHNGRDALTQSEDSKLGSIRLRQAQEDFYNLYKSGDLPSEFGFLRDIEGMELNNSLGFRPGLKDYLSATFSNIRSSVYYSQWDIKVNVLAFAPMTITGEPVGPIRMWAGSMSSNRLSNLRIYSHEVLHRNPELAKSWVKADSWAAAQDIHKKMEIVINKVKLNE